MPSYAFGVKNGHLEGHELVLPDDTAAIAEGLNTAGMLRELKLPNVGTSSQFLEITEHGKKVLQIDSDRTKQLTMKKMHRSA
ncbi:MAG: hypothetical protein WBE14_23395 [Xanthobacteraceae bacterium]